MVDGGADPRLDSVRRAYSAWSEGNLPAFLEFFHPEVELRPSGYFPDFNPVYRGHNGFTEFWHQIREPWEWFRIDLVRSVEGEEWIATEVRFRARGRGSGVETDLTFGHAMRFERDLVTHLATFTSFEQALDAAGLPATPIG